MLLSFKIPKNSRISIEEQMQDHKPSKRLIPTKGRSGTKPAFTSSTNSWKKLPLRSRSVKNSFNFQISKLSTTRMTSNRPGLKYLRQKLKNLFFWSRT